MTQSLEDYLEMVSFLADEGEIRVTDIASRLNVSKPSVLTALKVLEEEGLLEHERYGTVSLTKEGMARAAEIRDRHDVLTSFLENVVGVDAETAEKDACKMEHILSSKTFNKLKTLAKATKTPAKASSAKGKPPAAGKQKAPAKPRRKQASK